MAPNTSSTSDPERSIPDTMTAMAFDRYGDPSVLAPHTITTPSIADDEVLIAVACAGVGVWDGKQREGAMAGMTPNASFPIVPGADGAGTVVAVGPKVVGFAVGDVVYGYSFLSRKGGFHAEYVAVPSDAVAKVPAGMPLDQAGALAVPAITALCGLETLQVQAGDRVLVFGASGSVGHAAVQLAKALGATVLGVVASEDGAGLARSAGADPVVDTRLDDLPAALREFAEDELDAVLATVNGDGLAQAVAALRRGGRLAWPNGVQPVPESGPDVVAAGFDGRPDRALLDRLNALIASRPFTVPVSQVVPLCDAAAAHAALHGHHLGRAVLKVR